MTATVDFSAANNGPWKLRFNLTREGQPWDVEDYEARMQMRASAAADVAAAEFSTAVGTLRVDGTALVLDAPRGITLGIPAGAYVYDVLMTRGDETIRAIEGTITVKQGVTR